MPRPVDAVIEFLRAEEARGRTHILLDEDTRDCLRDLYRRSSNSLKRESSPAAQAPPQPQKVQDTKAEYIPLPSSPAPADPIVSQQIPEETGNTKAERIASLRAQAENWAPARNLGTLRTTMVFSVGNPEAKLMLVGEAPGYEEERRKEPFVGPAGQKLNDILKAMGISREEVYISNIVKFRPATPNQTTNNRKPTPEEMLSCLPFVQKEVSIISPACILALGGTAAEGLLALSGTVSSMRNSWHEFEGIPVRVTYHPSYLLQSGANLSIKRKLWEDMLCVMEKLQLPISEKQRSYFLPKT